MFSCETYESLKDIYFEEHLWTTVSNIRHDGSISFSYDNTKSYF